MQLRALLFALGVASTANAQSLESQIRAEVNRYVLAVNRGDAQAVASLYLNDPRTSSLGDGQKYVGWQTIAHLFREAYSRAGAIRIAAESLSVLPLGTNAAVAVMRYHSLIGRESPRPASGAMTLVYTRTPQGWRIAHDHASTLATSVHDAALAPAPADAGPRRPLRPTFSCTVTRIVDGDTIECSRAGRVRLIGIDTPELSQAPFGLQAAAALARAIPPGSNVQLERDVDERDQYNRLLAYVWLDGTQVNWRMIREGWAVLLTFAPNIQYVNWLTDAQRRAREERRGLWASEGFNCAPADRRRGRCE